MTTAEEWMHKLGISSRIGDEEVEHSLVNAAEIKAIQLDAWKQGMTDAETLGDNIAYGRRNCGNDHEMMARDSGIADLQQAIANKRDTKTSP